MARVIKNNWAYFTIVGVIFVIMTIWIFSGKLQISQRPAFPPKVQQVFAITATKTWTFDNDAEGLADAGNSAFVDFTYDGTDKAVNFYMNRKNTTQTEYARRVSTGETWETWGVPSGSVVTAVQITAWQEKTVNNTDLTSHTISARIIGSDLATVHSAGDLLAAVNPGTDIDTTYQDGAAGLERVVDAGSQASTTDVRLELEYTVTTAGSPNINQRFDTIQLTITYSAAPVYSVVIGDGYVNYGTLVLGATQDTLTLSDTQTATNDGNTTEKLNIIGSNSTPDNWQLQSTQSTNQYFHKFSTDGGNIWTALTTSDYSVLSPSIAQGATIGFDLMVGVPTITSAVATQDINVTIQATAP